ncbi:MAG: ribosomal RNA small subunit methyltransferase A [Thermodesulfobacteria bacterium]|nr:ribosomal RNA small subunit methyltransferase A [Thermodesulfobacteriota bacterium]
MLKKRLKKHFGQHLLVAKGVIKKLVEFMEIKENDVVVEIGPGTGNLTEELFNTPLKRLYLIEIDEDMIRILKSRFNDRRLQIIHQDAGNFDFSKLGETSLKVVGNLPYNVASRILENVVNFNNLISSAFFMLQKEVAIRIEKEASWLSFFVRTFYEVKYLMSLPPKFFVPPPKVESGFIGLYRREENLKIDPKRLKELLKKVFSQRRKMLKHKVSEEVLLKAGISPTARAEELKVSDIIKLYYTS